MSDNTNHLFFHIFIPVLSCRSTYYWALPMTGQPSDTLSLDNACVENGLSFSLIEKKFKNFQIHVYLLLMM